jgi:hypothetical protein
MKYRKQIAVLLTLCALLPAGLAARPHTAYASTVPAAHTIKACKAPAVPLTEGQMAFTTAGKPIDAICYIAGACSTVWPIGTLICGPTGIGCIIYYWKM